ncbi:MAG: DUF3800 domain-containing protein [Patescibacteria group bacterium]
MSKKRVSRNIYCDESSVDNPNSRFMTIGALFVDRKEVPRIKEDIKRLQGEHHIKGELKWVKTSERTLKFYEELFSYLFSLPSSALFYRSILIDKELVDYKKHHHGDKELAYYKFYYQLLKKPLEANEDYYISLDFRPSRDKNSVRRLGEFLKAFAVNEGVIKHMQAYSSDENIFIQISDILTGAVSHSRNIKKGSKNKKKLIGIIARSVGKDNLDFCSSLRDKRFNIFCIIPGRGK